MSLRDRAALIAVGMALAALAASSIQVPGYMDAEYYFVTGRTLAGGGGLEENFLWNYLDDPAGLPHPSHSYWMPLPSVVAAVGVFLFGPTFSAGRALFLILAGFLPLAAAELAFRLTSDRWSAWASGLLALAPGFYSAYLVTTDSFALYALLGALTLCNLAGARSGGSQSVKNGILVGLCHLTRADGILFLPLALGSIWADGRRPVRRAAAFTVGYAGVLAPFLVRNLVAFGSLFPPGQSRALWWLEYNDLFLFPASTLSAARWASAGWESIVGARLAAFGSNLLSLWSVNGLIFLVPLMILGAWRYRNDRLVRLTLAYLAMLLVMMSFVFPFAGARGGYFHSSIAAMPVLWALAPPGLLAFVEWGRRARGWDPRLGARVLGSAALLFAAALSMYKFWERTLGPDPAQATWSQSSRTYQELTRRLEAEMAKTGTVAVNNPPGFHLASGRPAVVVPSGGMEALRGVASSFDVEWVILEPNRPAGLDSLYWGHGPIDGFSFAFAWDDPEAGRIVVYQVQP